LRKILQDNGAEIWGTDKVKDIETVQNKFCKWLLATGQTTNNHIARGECGRYELYINHMCKPIKYILHLQRLVNSRLPKLCNCLTLPNLTESMRE
jgi:hypothetical protein